MTVELYNAAPPKLPSSKDLTEFDGLWVAVADGRVVASGKTLHAALKGARELGFGDPIVFRAPLRSPGRAYY
jgi:uncharacterized lipoprotein YddW (UPF0748 family)